MRGIKFLILVVIILSLFQFNLYSLITSRVEGTVIDKDTGQPIEGAEVLLFLGGKMDSGKDIGYMFVETIKKTNSNGYFKFDHLEREGEYFLSVFKKGYACIGPFYYIDGTNSGYIINELEEEAINRYKWLQKSEAEINTFYIKQGQIKHFKIKLEKEAVLEIKLYLKTQQGKEFLKDFGEMRLYHNRYFGSFEILDIPYTSEYLREGLAVFMCCYPGFQIKIFKNIVLKRGKTTTIEHVFDLTTGQTLHGFIKNKTTGEPIRGLRVHLYKLPLAEKKYSIESIVTDRSGELWFGGLEPGKYLLSTGYSPDDDREINHKEVLEIKPGEKKIIIRRF